MSSPRSFLLALLLTVLQLVFTVDAKGGGKGSSSKGSKSKSKIKPVAFRENGKCYDEQYATHSTPLISSPHRHSV